MSSSLAMASGPSAGTEAASYMSTSLLLWLDYSSVHVAAIRCEQQALYSGVMRRTALLSSRGFQAILIVYSGLCALHCTVVYEQSSQASRGRGDNR